MIIIRTVMTTIIVLSVYTNICYASDKSSVMLESLMKCDHDFEPAEIIKLLQREGIIGQKPIEEGDGIPTYLVLKPIRIFNKDIKLVEGWSSNKMFFRGHGTAPPTHIALGFGEPRWSYDSSIGKLVSEYPTCRNKISSKNHREGMRSIDLSNYSKEVGDQYKSFSVYVCTLSESYVSGPVEECSNTKK